MFFAKDFYLVENGTLIDIPLIENEEHFWDIMRVFQNGILAGNDLFISTPPQTIDFNGSPNEILFDSDLSLSNHENKRKSIEFDIGKYEMKV